jgi:hypothetical protein
MNFLYAIVRVHIPNRHLGYTSVKMVVQSKASTTSQQELWVQSPLKTCWETNLTLMSNCEAGNNMWLLHTNSFTVSVHLLFLKYNISVQIIYHVTSLMRWQWWMHDICPMFICEWCVLWSNRCGQSAKQVMTQALTAQNKACLKTTYVWVLMNTYHSKPNKPSGWKELTF